jgi:phosphoserine phosphatase RsbU/P
MTIDPTTPPADLDRLNERIRQLQAVVEASVLVNSTLDLKELAEHVISIATHLIGAERGSLFLVEGERLHSLVAQGLSDQTLSLRVGDGIVGTVAASGEAVILNDPAGDPRFDGRVDRATGFRTRSLLTVPVRDRNGTLVAVLQLLNHSGAGFSAADVAFLAELGVPFAIALTTARLHREIVERERFREELRLAAEIQRTLQPRDRAIIPGLELETYSRPCLEVGGDYYDVVPSSAGDRVWLVVADISGKGVAAGLIASNVQAYLWSRRDDRRGLERVIAEGNDLLYRLTRGRKYATLVVAEWRPSSRTLTWVNAGHPPLLIRHAGSLFPFEATGRPIGLLPDQSYTSRTYTLERDDLFLLYTDGVVEAGVSAPVGELGLERLMEQVAPLVGPAAVVAAVAHGIDAHLDGAAAEDDVTMLCARCSS